MDRFDAKVAVVTGAGSGFGAAIAERLAAEGASVVVADVDGSRGEHVTDGIAAEGGSAVAVRADVRRDADVADAVGAAVERFGGLDVLVSNAGLSHRAGPTEDLPEAEFDRVFDVNVKGVFLGAKHAIAPMRERGGGAIVNTASIGAVCPRPGATAYNASKGAVVTFTRGLAAELAPDIRVNAVNPVAAETGFMEGALGIGGPLPDEVRELLVGTIPMGRLCEPQDVAGAVAFLASDDARFLTGVCLPVDGGRSIG